MLRDGRGHVNPLQLSHYGKCHRLFWFVTSHRTPGRRLMTPLLTPSPAPPFRPRLAVVFPVPPVSTVH